MRDRHMYKFQGQSSEEQQVSVAYPVFRSGNIVRLVPAAKKSIPTVGEPDGGICAEPLEARLIGGRIIENYTDYVSKVADRLKGELGASKFEFMDDLSAKFVPGLVIDFPRFSFEIDRIRIETRFCITVCRDKNASKIWTRFLMINYHGEDALEVDIGAATGFYEILERVVPDILDDLLHLYKRDFCEVKNTRTTAVVLHRVQIRSADSRSPDFHKVVQEIEEGLTLNEIEGVQKAVAVEIFDLSGGDTKGSQEASEDEFVMESLEGQVGLFRRSSSGEVTTYTGLVNYSPLELEYRKQNLAGDDLCHGHPALELTAELTGHIGLQY